MIPGTKEFFIALSDHSEWGTAHTVWGEVEAALFWQNPILIPLHLHERTMTWHEPCNLHRWKTWRLWMRLLQRPSMR